MERPRPKRQVYAGFTPAGFIWIPSPLCGEGRVGRTGGLFPSCSAAFWDAGPPHPGPPHEWGGEKLLNTLPALRGGQGGEDRRPISFLLGCVLGRWTSPPWPSP